MSIDAVSLTSFATIMILALGLLFIIPPLVRKRRKASVSASSDGVADPENGAGTTFDARGVLPERFIFVAVIFTMLITALSFVYPWAIIFKEMAAAGIGFFLITVLSTFIMLLCLALFCAFEIRER